MKRALWLLAICVFAALYFALSSETGQDWLFGPPKPWQPPAQDAPHEPVKTAALVQPPNRPPPPPSRASEVPPPPLPPPVVHQPETVPENLPQGLRMPAANYLPDGGIIFPFNPKGIAAAIDEAKPEMINCYERWLMANPELRGKLEVSFTVVPTDGGDAATIDAVRLRNGGVGNWLFEGCVLSVVSELRFESPGNGPVEVRYPLTFNSTSWDAGP